MPERGDSGADFFYFSRPSVAGIIPGFNPDNQSLEKTWVLEKPVRRKRKSKACYVLKQPTILLICKPTSRSVSANRFPSDAGYLISQNLTAAGDFTSVSDPF